MTDDRDGFGRRDSDRLSRLEADFENLQRWVQADSIELQSLRASANMGKGAWAFIVKLGGVLVAVAGFFAWAWSTFGPRTHL